VLGEAALVVTAASEMAPKVEAAVKTADKIEKRDVQVDTAALGRRGELTSVRTHRELAAVGVWQLLCRCDSQCRSAVWLPCLTGKRKHMLEMVAATYDGAHAAEKALSDLRANRDDPWLSEVSIIEHDTDGRYSVKAKNPKVTDSKTGSGAAIGGLTGLLVGAIGGPLGLLFWSGLGAMTGAAVGASKESAFRPMVAEIEAVLPPGASSLILAGETQTLNSFVESLDVSDSEILRVPLNSEQAAELNKAASAG